MMLFFWYCYKGLGVPDGIIFFYCLVSLNKIATLARTAIGRWHHQYILELVSSQQTHFKTVITSIWRSIPFNAKQFFTLKLPKTV